MSGFRKREMMYFTDFFRNLWRKSNTGAIIWLILNLAMIVMLFYGLFGQYGYVIGPAVWLVSVMIALSPIGEWILRVTSGCKKVRSREIRARIDPIFNRVYAQAKRATPELSDKIRYFISYDSAPNAFATGRRTVCITAGLLKLPDPMIYGVLAHEFGHLAHKDTDLILVVSVGNMIVSAVFFTLRLLFRITGIVLTFVLSDLGALIGTFLTDILLGFLIWAWTGLGVLCVRSSGRRNEFEADAYAKQLGYGQHLEYALEALDRGGRSHGFFAALRATHPRTSDRCAYLAA